MTGAKPAVLFVCLGNICRSPLAEAAFVREAARIGLDADVASAGTGTWNLGKPADPRAQAVARAAGIDLGAHRARRVTVADFTRFGEIVALDRQNLADLAAMRPEEPRARLSLLLDWVPGRAGEAVRDPHEGDEAGFAETWADVTAGAAALAKALAERAEAREGS